MTDKGPATNLDIAALARSYNILDYDGQLRALAAQALPRHDLDGLKKPELHRLLSRLILGQFKGESTLKAKLVQRFVKQKVTAAFEIKVGRSRADFITINGDTKSFEIKSELDNLQKLPKQTRDYQQVFDYNYLVIDERHAKNTRKIVPLNYGILILHGGHLVEDRAALLNTAHDALAQLSLFTKKELAQTFRIPGITPAEIAINFGAEEINHWFKRMLKDRYTKRWQFLVQHRQEIHPIDYQFFFQHNIAPEIIYGAC